MALLFARDHESGRVLWTLSLHEGVDVARSGSLTNDVLIATSCRESDVVLITENVGHFAAIQRHLRGFNYVAAADVM